MKAGDCRRRRARSGVSNITEYPPRYFFVSVHFRRFTFPLCASVHFARLVVQSAVHSRKLKVGRLSKRRASLEGRRGEKMEAFDRQESGKIAGTMAGKRVDRRRTCVSIAYYHLVSN